MLKWKIGIGILVVIAGLVSVTSLYLWSLSPSMISSPNENPKQQQPNNVDKLIREMEFGSIAFNAPTNINIDDSHQIQLILSLAETVEGLKQSITEEGKKVGAIIKVSDRMEARLSGYMFQITAITPEIQAVSKSQQTEWKWEIHPKKEGKHRMHLTLTALLEIHLHLPNCNCCFLLRSKETLLYLNYIVWKYYR